MSYDKAMKHHKNIRKLKKQSHQYLGFACASGPWKSIWSNPRFVVGIWFKERHFGDKQHNRECIREQIAEARKAE